MIEFIIGLIIGGIVGFGGFVLWYVFNGSSMSSSESQEIEVIDEEK